MSDAKYSNPIELEITEPRSFNEQAAVALVIVGALVAVADRRVSPVERDEVIDLYQRVSGIPISGKSLAFYEAFALYQAAAIQMCAVHAFEVDGFNDMRMAVMASQMASIVRAFDRALEAAA